MIYASLTFLVIVVFWIAPVAVVISMWRDFRREKPSLPALFLKTAVSIFAFKIFVLFTIRYTPQPLDYIVASFGAVALIPELFIVRLFSKKGPYINQWFAGWASLALLSSLLISAGLTELKRRAK